MSHSEHSNGEGNPPRQAISFPLPKKVGNLVRNFSVWDKELPEEYTNFLQKTLLKMGEKRTSKIEQLRTPILMEILKSLPSDATYEDLFRRYCEIQEEILGDSRTLSATVPIICFKPPANKPEAHGSGVFVEIGGEYFLLTAAHVLDAGSYSDLEVGLNAKFAPLADSWWYQSPLPLSGDRKDDNEDIGYCRFDSEEILKELNSSSHILRRPDVILNESIDHHGLRVCGYPANKVEIGTGTVDPQINSLEGFEITPIEYETLGLSPEVNIAIRYNKKRAFSGRLTRTITPISVLNGMSGGGIYLESPEREPPFVKFLLVGITTTYYQDKSIIIGTRLSAIVSRIFRNRPEFAARVNPQI